MSGESPVSELYDSNGNPLAVQNATAIPANTPGLMTLGSDGTNSRYILVDSTGRQIVASNQIGNVDSGNSSTTPLASNGTFAGTGIDVSAYGIITVMVYTDKGGTLNLEFSTDNTNWDFISHYTISANTVETAQIGPLAQYFRVVYQNGNQAQGFFRLQTIERPITSFGQTTPIAETVDTNMVALLTKSAIVGRSSQGGGTYVDVKVSPSGALLTDNALSSGTTTTSSVAASTTNQTLLAQNTTRLGATFWNESTTATLYIKLGTTASLTDYTVQVFPSGYYEVPYGYFGEIDGIWSAPVGNVRITELT